MLDIENSSPHTPGLVDAETGGLSSWFRKIMCRHELSDAPQPCGDGSKQGLQSLSVYSKSYQYSHLELDELAQALSITAHRVETAYCRSWSFLFQTAFPLERRHSNSLSNKHAAAARDYG
jgi:hypothetical protein